MGNIATMIWYPDFQYIPSLLQDRAPLEADKPQLRPEIEKAAEGCMEGLETTTHENSKDPYTAQLEKSKAAKVLSAEKLLDKAKSDPKVQKKLKEKTGRGRGRGRGRGKAGNVDDQEKSKKADENEHVDGHDEGEQAVEGGPAPSTSEPAPKDESSPDDPAAALATQWAAKAIYSGGVVLCMYIYTLIKFKL